MIKISTFKNFKGLWIDNKIRKVGCFIIVCAPATKALLKLPNPISLKLKMKTIDKLRNPDLIFNFILIHK